MKQVAAYIFQALGVLSGAFCAGTMILVYFNVRDYDDNQWVWLLIIAMLLFLLCATSTALGITLDDPQQKMRKVHPSIAVGRSGAPEITDPMPGPARVRRPVSGAYSPEKNSF